MNALISYECLCQPGFTGLTCETGMMIQHSFKPFIRLYTTVYGLIVFPNNNFYVLGNLKYSVHLHSTLFHSIRFHGILSYLLG